MDDAPSVQPLEVLEVVVVVAVVVRSEWKVADALSPHESAGTPKCSPRRKRCSMIILSAATSANSGCSRR